MAEQKVLTLSGVLRGVEVTEGKGKNGSWKRASLKLEITKEGKSKDVYASTFNENDLEAANKANGKEIRIKFTKKDKYRNIIEGGIEVIGQGEEPVDEEESVEEEGSNEMTEKEGRKMDPTTKSEQKSFQTKDGYWADKFEFEKKTYKEKQISIVRQNSWAQALKYVESCLTAVELGVLDKKEFSKEDLNLNNIAKIAHQIEEDINGTKRLK